MNDANDDNNDGSTASSGTGYQGKSAVEAKKKSGATGKGILAFATPQNKARDEGGFQTWTPEAYSPLFHEWNIGLVIRLNKVGGARIVFWVGDIGLVIRLNKVGFHSDFMRYSG